MDIIYPNTVYQKLPPNKLTKGPLSFQKQLQTSLAPSLKKQEPNKSDAYLLENDDTKASSISSSSSGDLIEFEFEQYQKALRNPNKAIRDEFTLTKKIKRKNKPLKTKLISQNVLNLSKPAQITNSVQNIQEKAPTVSAESPSKRSISSTNICRQNCNIRIPNGHISSLSKTSESYIASIQNAGSSHDDFNSNFNPKSRYDPFDNSYIYNLDLNLNLDLNKPKLNVTGQSIVGASISHLRPQKMSTFEEKKSLDSTARVNWIQFRANPVKKYKPYAPPISKEDQFLKKLMTKEGLMEARKKNEALILLRKQKAEDEKISSFANSTICPTAEKATTNQKVKVISKTMALNDY